MVNRVAILLVAAAALLAAPAASFGNAPARRVASAATSSTRLDAYKIGTKTEGLLINNRRVVDALAKSVDGMDGVDMSGVDLLRFAMVHPEDERAAVDALQSAIKWRKTKGKRIVESAKAAVEEATAGGGWNNEPVRNAAPHSDLINKYITPKAVITTSTEAGDLVYVIRASQIDDKELMDNASVDQVCDFFMYAKEVHNIIANKRSAETGRMCTVIFANDISGVRKAPDSRFSKALTSSSDQYESLYPSLAGPTMILNLPLILQAFVGLLKPLFPKSVQARLVFKRAPVLASLKVLTPLGTDKVVQTKFAREVVGLLPVGA